MTTSTIELTERQAAVMVALHLVDRPATAGTITAKFSPGSDSRGTAQTMRALRRIGLVDYIDGGYKFTKAGAAKVRRLVAA